MKTIKYYGRPPRIIGVRIYIYSVNGSSFRGSGFARARKEVTSERLMLTGVTQSRPVASSGVIRSRCGPTLFEHG